MTRTSDIEQAAAAWLARHDRGDLNAEELQAFRRWLDADLERRVAYIRLEAAWVMADRLKSAGYMAQASGVAE